MGAYTKTTWVAGVTPLSSTNMNNLETQYDKVKEYLTTRGDILYRAASDWARLAKGAQYTVLTMGADDPSWVAPYAGPTTQQVVTGSRASGTVYQNTTGKPMFISANVSAATLDTMSAYTDSSNPPTTVVVSDGGGSSEYTATVFFIVLPGNYYKIVSPDGFGRWTEWY